MKSIYNQIDTPSLLIDKKNNDEKYYKNTEKISKRGLFLRGKTK